MRAVVPRTLRGVRYIIICLCTRLSPSSPTALPMAGFKGSAVHVTYEKEDRVLILAFKVRNHTVCAAAHARRLCAQTMRRRVVISCCVSAMRCGCCCLRYGDCFNVEYFSQGMLDSPVPFYHQNDLKAIPTAQPAWLQRVAPEARVHQA